MTDPLVLPVGHYMGAFYPATDAPLKYRKVRLGVDVKQLSEEQFTLWALTHGMPHQSGRTRWTRAAVRELARLPRFDEVLDSLVADGLVAEVSPGATAVEFGRTHRLQPLMMGLGNSPDDPLRFSIGLLGVPPVAKVESFVFELWQWCRLGHDLMETAELFAKVEQEVNGGQTGAEQLIGDITEQLHVLLAHNAAYLDTTLGPATEAG
ncbi:MAG: hypothetical protein ACRDT6_18940 [Micromonosporaceae bacterium]